VHRAVDAVVARHGRAVDARALDALLCPVTGIAVVAARGGAAGHRRIADPRVVRSGVGGSGVGQLGAERAAAIGVAVLGARARIEGLERAEAGDAARARTRVARRRALGVGRALGLADGLGA